MNSVFVLITLTTLHGDSPYECTCHRCFCAKRCWHDPVVSTAFPCGSQCPNCLCRPLFLPDCRYKTLNRGDEGWLEYSDLLLWGKEKGRCLIKGLQCPGGENSICFWCLLNIQTSHRIHVWYNFYIYIIYFLIYIYVYIYIYIICVFIYPLKDQPFGDLSVYRPLDPERGETTMLKPRGEAAHTQRLTSPWAMTARIFEAT